MDLLCTPSTVHAESRPLIYVQPRQALIWYPHLMGRWQQGIPTTNCHSPTGIAEPLPPVPADPQRGSSQAFGFLEKSHPLSRQASSAGHIISSSECWGCSSQSRDLFEPYPHGLHMRASGRFCLLHSSRWHNNWTLWWVRRICFSFITDRGCLWSPTLV